MSTRNALRALLLLAVSLTVSLAIEWQDTVYVSLGGDEPYRTPMNNAWGVQSYDYLHSWFNPPQDEVVHAVFWYDNGYNEIHYSRSTDGGASWNLADTITISDGTDDDEAWTPAVVTYGATNDAHDVQLVYYDEDSISGDWIYSVLRRQNTAEGNRSYWETSQRVSPSGWEEDCYRPSAATCRRPDDTKYNLYAVWEDEHEELNSTVVWYFRRDFSQGSSYEYSTNREQLTQDDDYDDLNPCVAAIYYDDPFTSDENYIYVVWYDYSTGDHTNAEVWFTRSTDTGDNWSSPVNLSNTASYESQVPCVAAIDEHVYVVWQEEKSDGRFEIRFKHSTNYGASWDSSVGITEDLMEELDHNDPPECFTPSIACYEDYVYVVCQAGWDSPTEWYTLGFMMSDDNGDNWVGEGVSSGGTEDLPDLEDGDIGLFPSVSVSKGPGQTEHKYLNVLYSVWDEYDDYQVCYLRGNDVDELPGGGGGGQGGWRTTRVTPSLRIYPSLARGRVKLTVELHQHDAVSLSLYNTAGVCVRELGSGLLAAGTYDVSWDVTDEHGRKVSAGTYLAVLKSSAGVVSSRVQLLEE